VSKILEWEFENKIFWYVEDAFLYFAPTLNVRINSIYPYILVFTIPFWNVK